MRGQPLTRNDPRPQSEQARRQVARAVVLYLIDASLDRGIWNPLLTKWERLCTVCPIRLYCPCVYTDLSERRPYCPLFVAVSGKEGRA